MGLFDSIGDLFSGAAKAVGQIAGPVLGFAGGMQEIKGQQATNVMNAEEAKKLRDWQEYMSNTAHQREMNDLRVAGLNPILTATGGSGAGTPAGAMATMKNPYEGLSNNINAARRISEIEKAQLEQTDQRIKNENKLADSTVTLNQYSADNQNMQAGAAFSTSMKNAQEIERIGEEQKLLQEKQRTEIENRALMRAQAAHNMSGVTLNSAYAKKSLAEAGLRNYDITEREFTHQVKKWTGPAREVLETAQDAVDVVVPLRPKQYMKVYP